MLLKIFVSIVGVVGFGMGALHVLLAAFALGGMDPSSLTLIGEVVPLVAEVLAFVALIVLWWRPYLATGLFVAASVLFFGALVFMDVIFAHVSGLDLITALFTTPRNVFVLPSWIPLFLAGLLSWYISYPNHRYQE